MGIEKTNSRTEFVNQVARSIVDAQNDPDRKESFIFGLSAKWGEGKTYFLNQLRSKLNDTVIIEINPWKYSDNKTTFLQSFLIDIINQAPKKNKVSKSDILQTKSVQKINWDNIVKNRWVWVFLAIYIILIFGVQFLDLIPLAWLQANNTVLKSCLQVILTALYGSFLIPLFTKTSTDSVSDYASSVLINFDDDLDRVIKTFGRKKLVVYVDDLDRISAKNAITVLDNLRTFFDKKELCFIVSGDHSVIERYLGDELLQGDDSGARLEEGRRYLKKIFNIYWRLPIPIDSEIREYISDQIKNKLGEFRLAKEEKEQLAALLNQLFGNNYRNIERMVAQIAFTLRIVSAKLKSCKDETKIYYQDLWGHKMLLVKVLLIQELANPYYEYLLKHPDCLRQSDKDQNIVSEDGYDSFERLSANQMGVLHDIIKASPRFHGNNGLVVCDVKTFVYLAADSSFGDNRGLLASEFETNLYEASLATETFRLLLDQHSITMLASGIDATYEKNAKQVLLAKGAGGDIMQRNMINLIARLGELGDEYSKQKAAFNRFFNTDFLTKLVNAGESPELLQVIGAYIDKNSLTIDSSDMLMPNDINQFVKLVEYAADPGSISPLYANILWRQFDVFYAQYHNNFIAKLGLILDRLPAPGLSDSTLNAMVSIIDSYFSQETGVVSAKVLAMANDATTTDSVIERMKQRLVQLAVGAVGIIEILDKANLDKYLTEVLATIADYRSLAQRLRFVIDSGLDTKTAWRYIIDNNFAVLLNNISTDLADFGGPASPSSEVAKLIAHKVVRYVKEHGQNNLLSAINKNNYCFKNLSNIKGDSVATKYLKTLADSDAQPDKDNAQALLDMKQ